MTDEEIDPNQHCTAKDCFTFSHTAMYCGAEQPRRCGCAFCYPEGSGQPIEFDPGFRVVDPEALAAYLDVRLNMDIDAIRWLIDDYCDQEGKRVGHGAGDEPTALTWRGGHPDNDPVTSTSVQIGYAHLVASINEANKMIPPNLQFSVPLGVQEALSRYVEERETIERLTGKDGD